MTRDEALTAQRLVRQLAEPAPAADKAKAAVNRAASRLPNWNFGRVRALWYAEDRIELTEAEWSDLEEAVAISRTELIGQDPRALAKRVMRLERIVARLVADDDLPFPLPAVMAQPTFRLAA